MRIDRSALENARYLEVSDRICRLERDVEVLTGMIESRASGYALVAQVPAENAPRPWYPIVPLQGLT